MPALPSDWTRSVFDRLFRRSPSAFQLRINGADTPITVQAKESILLAALREGVAFPYNCRVGGCGECKCRLVSGKVKELSDKSYLLSAEEIQQNVILACQSQPRSDVVIEVTLKAAGVAHPMVAACGTITALTSLTPDILHLQLKLDRPMAYTAGQSAEITIPGDAAGQTRSYSFASAHKPERPDEVDFFIRKVPGGAFTTWLFEQSGVGSTLALHGPCGDFSLQAGDSPIVAIAGGSGLAPIHAMLEQALNDRQAHRPTTVVLGVRTQADLYGLDAIGRIGQHWQSRFLVVPVLSDEPAGSHWAGLRGMVTEHLATLLGSSLFEHQAYMCGPPPMIDACTALLTQQGMPLTQVHADKFLDRSHLR